ncbi:polysaccharide biosynthesis protein PelE [Pararobbsia alpina]|uniref:tetratricopeptide repeat protein n=1 Tax=Pararobbsia alpina TaxID=621374 RepID=UPI0039A776B7
MNATLAPATGTGSLALTVTGVLVTAVLGVVFQLLALLHLVHPVQHRFGSIDPLLVAVVLQAITAALIATGVRWVLPAQYRKPVLMTWLLLFSFCMFVPVIGSLVCVAGIVWSLVWPSAADVSAWTSVKLPNFAVYLVSRIAHGSGARLQAKLANPRLAIDDRVTALVAIQSMPTRTTGGVLRDLLGDPVEDVRLLAYGMLDAAEKKITQRIYDLLGKLNEDAPQAEVEETCRVLAELYWELIYQNLVQGEMRTFAAQQVEKYAQRALAIDDSNAALWVTRGRLALSLGQVDIADEYFEKALSRGFPGDRLLPWIAESAYLRGDYRAVKTALAALGEGASLPALRAIAQYWSK